MGTEAIPIAGKIVVDILGTCLDVVDGGRARVEADETLADIVLEAVGVIVDLSLVGHVALGC